MDKDVVEGRGECWRGNKAHDEALMKKKMNKETIDFIVVGMNFDANLLSRQFLMDDDAM